MKLRHLPVFVFLAAALSLPAADTPKPAENKPAAPAPAAPPPTAPKPDAAKPADKPTEKKPEAAKPADKPAEKKTDAPKPEDKKPEPPKTAAKPEEKKPEPPKPAAPPPPVPVFKDKQLEAAVRKQVFAKRESKDPLFPADVENVSVIQGKGLKITDLSEETINSLCDELRRNMMEAAGHIQRVPAIRPDER